MAKKDIINVNDWQVPAKLIDFTDKDSSVQHHVRKMLNICQSMIEIDGLPDTMPKRNILRYQQVNGFVAVLDPKYTDGNMYGFYGGLGGEPDPYYLPTICTISNPSLNISGNYKIHDDVVIVPHDPYYMGLMPILNRYCSMLVENELTMWMTEMNARIPWFISANDSRTYESVKDFINGIVKGKLSAVFDSSFMDECLKTNQFSNSSNENITKLIEMEQYIKASMFNDIGLNANYNMKRESLNSAESQMNDDALLPFVDIILDTMNKGWEEVNEKFGTNIKAKLGSAWEDRQKIQQNQIEEGKPLNIDDGKDGDNDDETKSV